jgi:hypothetical protein
MTAPRAKLSERPSASTIASSAVGVVTWVIYYTSLVVVYVIAYRQNDLPGQRAAAWSMSISLTVAALVFQAAFGWLAAWGSAFLPRRLPAPAVGGVLLAVASIALIWVGVTLAFDGDSTGSWVLALPASTSPLALVVLNYRPTVKPPPDDAEKPGEHDPTRGVSQVGPGAAVSTQLATDEVVGPADEGIREAETVTADETGPVPEEIAVAARWAGLLALDWPSRLKDLDLPVALDGGFWRSLQRGLAADSEEQGGVALTARADGVLLLLGAVFPVQLGATSTHCEFSTADVDRVRRALDGVSEDLELTRAGVNVTWIHTHPRLGVFLSGTDHQTARTWRGLDPDFTPIVVDITKRNLPDRVGIFNAIGEQILPMGITEGLVDAGAAARLTEAVLRTYRLDDQPEPLVLLSSKAQPNGGERGARRRRSR